jgi:hypothetical protein
MGNSDYLRLIPILDAQAVDHDQYDTVVKKRLELKEARVNKQEGLDSFLSSRWLFVPGLIATIVGFYATVQVDHWWPAVVGLVLYAACLAPIFSANWRARRAMQVIDRLESEPSDHVLFNQKLKLMWCVVQRAHSHNEKLDILSVIRDVVGHPLSDEEIVYCQRFRTDVMDEFAEMGEVLAILAEQCRDNSAKTPVQARLLGYLTMSPEEFQREHLFRFQSPTF